MDGACEKSSGRKKNGEWNREPGFMGESVAVRIARDEKFLPFKINPPDLYVAWQMATESGAEINRSTASGRLHGFSARFVIGRDSGED